MAIEALDNRRDDKDFEEHLRTYHGFLRTLAWCVGLIVVVLVLLASWGG